MIVFINGLTGTKMLVADSRKEEYIKAGFIPAFSHCDEPTEEPVIVEEPKEEPVKEKPKRVRTTRKKK